MKTDVKGCSTCKAGEEHFERFSVRSASFVQYDYRDAAGNLFSTVKPSLDQCREARDKWLNRLTN